MGGPNGGDSRGDRLAVQASILGGAEASREAARAERERIAALYDSRKETTESALLEARKKVDPEGLATERGSVFNFFADFIKSIPADSDFGPNGRFAQFFNALGSVDLYKSGDIDKSQLGSLGSRLLGALEEYGGIFGNMSAVEIGRLFLGSDLFDAIFGTPTEETPTAGAPTAPSPVLDQNLYDPAAYNTNAYAFATSPTAAVSKSCVVNVEIGEITIEAVDGDPDLIAAEIAGGVRTRLVDEFENAVDDLDSDVDR